MPIQLLFLAKHEPRKGLDDLMNALMHLHQHSWHLRVGGAGWEWDPDILQMVSLLPNGSVSFLGRVENTLVGQLMKTCDIVVVPSHYEHFGNVAIEAQAAGVSLIVAKVGGLKDVVQDGETGLHYEARDVEGLAKCLRRLFECTQLREQLGQAAAARARRLYPWPRVARLTDRLLTYTIARAQAQK